MFCSECGKEIIEGDHCSNCGTKIEEPIKVQLDDREHSINDMGYGVLGGAWLLFIFVTLVVVGLYFNSWILFSVISAIGTFLMIEFKFKKSRSLKGKIGITLGIMILLYASLWIITQL